MNVTWCSQDFAVGGGAAAVITVVAPINTRCEEIEISTAFRYLYVYMFYQYTSTLLLIIGVMNAIIHDIGVVTS